MLESILTCNVHMVLLLAKYVMLCMFEVLVMGKGVGGSNMILLLLLMSRYRRRDEKEEVSMNEMWVQALCKVFLVTVRFFAVPQTHSVACVFGFEFLLDYFVFGQFKKVSIKEIVRGSSLKCVLFLAVLFVAVERNLNLSNSLIMYVPYVLYYMLSCRETEIETNKLDFVEPPPIITEEEDTNENTDTNSVEAALDGLMNRGDFKMYSIEAKIKNLTMAVAVRRAYVQRQLRAIQNNSHFRFDNIQHANYNYELIYKQCCENVIGYASIPLGVVGPLVLNRQRFYVPLSTTEGCLVASVNRGMSAIRASGGAGVRAFILKDGMTRCPVLRCESLQASMKLKVWLETKQNFALVKKKFDSTSKYLDLKEITVFVAGQLVFLRFRATTGNAMGMNMVSKGVDFALKFLLGSHFRNGFELLSISGNACSDKKASAINWIEGRGKSVSAEISIPESIVRNVLKVDSIDRLIEIHVAKNYVGSALAGSIGGFNAHASNIVAGIFASTGQDLGQIVESSSCLTILSKSARDGATFLVVSCTMPSVEVATVGGGTVLPSQQACLNMMNVYHARMCSEDEGGGCYSPTEVLAMVCCATVLAGEISLLSSLCANTLVSSHLSLNRNESSAVLVQSLKGRQEKGDDVMCDPNCQVL